MTTLAELLDRRAANWAAMNELRTVAADLSAEQREQWDRIESALTTDTEDIERLQRADAIGRSLEAIDFGRVITPALAAELPSAGDAEAAYRGAFDTWVRHGIQSLTPEQSGLMQRMLSQLGSAEARALGVGTASAGGYLVPAEFRAKLIETLKWFGPMRQVAEVITTDSGTTLPWPTNNDTANVGAILAENTAMTEQDIVLGTASLEAYMYTSKMVRVSLQLIQDAGISIDGILPRKLGERIGRIQNQHFTTGTGTAQPLGLIPGGTAVQAATGNVATVPYALLVDVITAIDPAYLQGGNCQWMLSSTALGVFRKVVDTAGRPIWEPSVQAGQPDQILGYGVQLNNDLAVPAASAKFGAFGDFRSAYIIRDVTGVQIMQLRERYAEFLQVAYAAFQRSGGTVQDASAYRVLQNSAT